MALTDKNIAITPNIGSADDPKIVFSGADSSTTAQNITLRAYPTSNGTLSFEGSAGQLFTITNNLTGTIYSVNDISGIPSIEVLDTGTVRVAQYGGSVALGNVPTPAYKLDINNGGSAGSKLFRATYNNTNYLYGYADSGGTGITNSDPYSSGGLLYFTGTSSYLYSGSSIGLEVVGTSARSYLFYDRDDTGYYMDPNSTSRMSQINYNSLYYAGDTNYGFVSTNVYADTLNSGYASDPLELCYHRGSWCGISHDSLRAPLFYDYSDTAYYVDPASTSVLYKPSSATQQRWSAPWRAADAGNVRPMITGDSNYWTTTMGWGVDYGTWATFWKYGFGGFDCWGGSTDHPQGSGYVHAQGIQSGLHYSTSDGSTGYGWQMVGAADANSRWWLRGKWGNTTYSWYEIALFGRNVGGNFYANIMYDSDDTNYYCDPASTSKLNVALTNYNRRPDHHLGHLEGSYNNVGANDAKSNPIYTIGSSYNPAAASLSNMYGIGYSHSNFFGSSGGADWGLYVCAAGAYSALITHAGAWFRQNVTAYSDIRVKTNIARIENAIEKVKSLNGYTYDRLDMPEGSPRQTGVVAQEVLQVLPEAVSGSDEEHYSVAYGNMVGLLIEAIKEQQVIIDELRKQAGI